jgi:uncharacterized protein (TIGR03437 family)
MRVAPHTAVRLSLTICVSLLSPGLLAAQPGVLTWHNDNARTGQNLQETTLTPANVNASTFGKLFTMQADGKVDAQPLYVPALPIPQKGARNVLFVATEHDSAYAFDADTGERLWHVSLLGANETPSDDRGCFQVTPEIGVTATPVIDPQRGPHGTIYLIAMSKDSSGAYHHRLHALDLATGDEEFAGPVEVEATYAGSGVEGSGSTLTFDPKVHKHRAALLLANGTLYTSWGSHCDNGRYTGWIITYNPSTLQQTGVLNIAPNGFEAGIWASGAGPAADAAGNLFVAAGNGTFDTNLNADRFPSKGDFGNAFLRLTGSLAVTDYFTMSNTAAESNADLDLGSGGLILLPQLTDVHGNSRALAVGGGKDGTIYVVDQDNLGKFSPTMNADYQQLPGTTVFSTPAWFNGTLYYGTVGSTLKAVKFQNGMFGPSPSSQSPTVFPYPGTTPSISASGSSNGIVWAAENGSTAVLHAYDATDLTRELYNSNQAVDGRDHFGEGNKYIVPTVVNGKVYVGTTTGVGAFGLLNSSTGQLSMKSAASFASGIALAPDMIAFGQASGIAASTTITSENPWPAILGGVHLDITDSQGQTRPTPIYFVMPDSITFQIPAGTALGPASATLTTSAGGTLTGTLNLERTSPGLFTANASGSGVPAGFWIKVAADSHQTQGYLFDPSQPSGNRAPVPVDLGSPGDQVFLSLYGTGFRNASGATASVGGTTVSVYAFAAVEGYQGEDVVNVGPLPRSLAGRGQVDISLSFDGKATNTVTVSIL